MSSTVIARLVLSVWFLLPLVAAYSFEITQTPTQCGPLSLQITQGSGNPPYTALVAPFGPPPGLPEERFVFEFQFSDISSSFTLPYPAGSNFVIMVSDSNGVGTGGTSVPISVGGSKNSSCFSFRPPLFTFNILPNNAINQCQPTLLAWNTTTVVNATFLLLIPGGQSFGIDTVNPMPVAPAGAGFSWTPNVPTSTTILLVASDSRGAGTGGSVNTVVGHSQTVNPLCLDGTSPSSTAGTPAGAFQTSSSSNGGGSVSGSSASAASASSSGAANNGGASTGSGSHRTNLAPIVGGILGGLAVLATIAALLFIRWRRRQQHPAGHSVDLLTDAHDYENPAEFVRPEPFIVVPQLYQPRPFIRPPSQSQVDPGMSDVGLRYNALPTTDKSESMSYRTTAGTWRSVTAEGSTSGDSTTNSSTGLSWKGPVPSETQPVSFVQHQDAGQVPQANASSPRDEPETVELPPSYNSVQR